MHRFCRVLQKLGHFLVISFHCLDIRLVKFRAAEGGKLLTKANMLFVRFLRNRNSLLASDGSQLTIVRSMRIDHLFRKTAHFG